MVNKLFAGILVKKNPSTGRIDKRGLKIEVAHGGAGVCKSRFRNQSFNCAARNLHTHKLCACTIYGWAGQKQINTVASFIISPRARWPAIRGERTGPFSANIQTVLPELHAAAEPGSHTYTFNQKDLALKIILVNCCKHKPSPIFTNTLKFVLFVYVTCDK